MSVRKDQVQIRVELDSSQGIQELGKLENEVAEIQRSMKLLKRDTDAWKNSQEQLGKAKAEMDALREKIGLTGLTMRQLTKYQGELRQQMANTTHGTEKWHELDGKLKEVTATVNKQKGVLSDFQKSWGSVKEELFSMGAQAAVVGVLVGIGAAITQVISKNGQLADSLSNIQKTSGMSSKEVSRLNSELSQIDTRTARDELRGIAAVAGQLAIPNAQILDFVKATDKLNVALGDEIQGGAEEVTRVMGGLRNIMTDIKTDDVGEDMLHIGNALNVLAAEGAATAPVIADIANRIGGVGQVMGLTSGQTLGLAATMQELNISAERGGTAVVKILQHMAAAPEKFAAVTKLSAQEFAQLVDKDIYGALKLVMEGAAGGQTSATALASTLDALGVDGAGASEVIAKMGLNMEMLDKKTSSATKSLTETESIIGEFNTLNDNFAGKLERIGKWWNGLFTANAMKPMLEGMVNWLDKLVSARSLVDELGAAWRENQEQMKSLTNDVEPLLERYKELAFAFRDNGEVMAQNSEQQAELDKVIQDIAEHIPEAVTAWNEYGNAMAINTKVAQQAIEQQKNMLRVSNAERIRDMEEQLKREEETLQFAVGRKNRILERATTANGSVRFWKGDTEAMEQLSKTITEAKKNISGLKGLLAEATGEKTEAQLAKEASARAAAAAREAAQKLADAKKHLGLLQQIEDEIKRLKELQQHVGEKEDDDPKELARLQKKIREQEEYRARLLGEYKAKAKKKDKDELEKEHTTLLRQFRALQEIARKEQVKLREISISADEQELNQVAAHFDELLRKARAFSTNTKLTEQERREALQTIDLLADEKEEALANKKAEQRKRRRELEFRHEVAEVQAQEALKVLLAQGHLQAQEENPMSSRQDRDDARVKLQQAQVSQIIHLRDLELMELDKLREKDLLSEKDIIERKKLINAEADAAMIAAAKRTSEEIYRDNMQRMASAFQQMQQVANTAINVVATIEGNWAKQDEQKYKKSVKALDNNLKAKVISQEEYNAKKNELDTQYEHQAAMRQKEAAETKKGADIFNATVNGIVAVTKTLAELGPIAGPPMAVIIGAMAAAEVAMIMATPIPEFREGGFTTEEALALPHRNLSRSQGGMLPSGPFLATVNEAGTEYFVPHKLLSDPRVRPHVQAIEAIRTTGSSSTAAGFAQGGATSSTGTSAGAMGYAPATSTAPGNGGQMSEATGQALLLSNQAILVQLVELNTGMRDGSIHAQVVPEQLARTTNLQKQIRYDASYNQ